MKTAPSLERLERQGGGDVTVQQILTYLTEKVPA